MRKAAIVVALAAVAIAITVIATSLHEALERSRWKRTMSDMRTIAIGLEARAEDVGSFTIDRPARSTATRAEEFGALQRIPLRSLERALVPRYVLKFPRRDAWGQEFDVRVGAYDAQGKAMVYAMRSYGSDGRADAEVYTHRVTTSPAADIVFANGNFLQFQEGV